MPEKLMQIQLEYAQEILQCINCPNFPTHRLDTRSCTEFSDIQVIEAANKGACRKKPNSPKPNKYPVVR